MSKKRIYYEEGITSGLENMMKQAKYNPSAANISDQASYSDSYASILNGMLTNASNATNSAIRKGKAFSPVDAMKAQIMSICIILMSLLLLWLNNMKMPA